MKFAEWITNAENEYAWTHDGGAIIFPAATEALDKLVNNPPEIADDPVFKLPTRKPRRLPRMPRPTPTSSMRLVP